jgi:hypothetical protein
MGDDLGLRQAGARRLDDEQLDGLAGLVVGHADAGAFGHAGAGGGHGLDLVRVDVEARDDDHVLLAVDDLQEALVVEHADVARRK